MADWKPLAAAGGIAALATAGWLAWDRARLAEDPPRLFRARCSTCHELPDLSGFRSEDMSRIVRTMRDNNGAETVISEAEATVIVGYLEEMARR